jgi:flagellar basal-body rod protein FlgC
MVSLTAIASSGLAAQSQRLDASASNVANARTRGAVPNPDGTTPAGKSAAYQPIGVAQTALATGNNQPAGTRATFTPMTPAYIPEYDPGDANANGDGLVAAPNVDLAGERVNQLQASAAYRANVAVVKTEDEMLKSMLDAKV